MCSGSEAGSYLRLIEFVYHSTVGLRVIKKKKKQNLRAEGARNLETGHEARDAPHACHQNRIISIINGFKSIVNFLKRVVNSTAVTF